MEILQDNCNELPPGQSRRAAKEQRRPVVWPTSKTHTRRPHHDSLTPHSALATIQHPATSGGAFKTQRLPLAAARASSFGSSAPGPRVCAGAGARRAGGGNTEARAPRGPRAPGRHARGSRPHGRACSSSGSRHGCGHGRRPGIPRTLGQARGAAGRTSRRGRAPRGGGGGAAAVRAHPRGPASGAAR